jgi:site-specific DNA recombinase
MAKPRYARCRNDDTLRSVCEPLEDDYNGKFMEGIYALVAELDNSARAERSVKGMKQKLEMGFWTFPPPLGYVAGRDNQGDKNLLPDPERANFVTYAFEQFATGLYTRQQVLKIVNAKGLRTRKGEPVPIQTFVQTLRKPVYAGRIAVYGVKAQGRFMPLVSEETFAKVQLLLDHKLATITPRERNHEDFPLRNFVRCGDCGEPLTGSYSRGRGRYYAYYHCQEGCTRVPKEEFETGFVNLLKRLEPKPEYIAFFREVVLEVLKTKQASSLEVQSALERKLRELRTRRERLEEAFVFDRTIDAETFNRMKIALLAEITLTEMELQEAALEVVNATDVIDFALDVLVNTSNRWKAASVDEKQRLQQVIFPEALEYAEGDYRTTATCMFFNGLEIEQTEREALVALPGIEPGF